MRGRLTFLESRRFFIVSLILSIISLVPVFYPVLYLDSNPVYMVSYSDPGPVHVYIDVLDRYHIAYLPMLMVSIGLLALSLVALMDTQFIALDYIFLFLIAYTASTVPVMRILSVPLDKNMITAVSGVIVTLSVNKIEYTWLFYLLKSSVLFSVGLFLSVASGVYITLSRNDMVKT